MGPGDPFRGAPPDSGRGGPSFSEPRPAAPTLGFVAGAGLAASILHLGWSSSAIVLLAGLVGWSIVGVASGRLDFRGAINALLRK